MELEHVNLKEKKFWIYPFFIFPDKMDSVKDVLGKWGKKAAEATKKAEDLAGNMWQHCKFWIVYLNSYVGRVIDVKHSIFLNCWFQNVFDISLQHRLECLWLMCVWLILCMPLKYLIQWLQKDLCAKSNFWWAY